MAKRPPTTLQNPTFELPATPAVPVTEPVPVKQPWAGANDDSSAEGQQPPPLQVPTETQPEGPESEKQHTTRGIGDLIPGSENWKKLPVPTVGRTVLYAMSATDAEQIMNQRGIRGTSSQVVKEGDVLPLIITQVVGGGPTPPICGHVLQNGPETLWVSSRLQDPENLAEPLTWPTPGTWHWPLRV